MPGMVARSPTLWNDYSIDCSHTLAVRCRPGGTSMIAQPSLLEAVDALYARRQDAIDTPYPIYDRMREESPVLIHRGVAAIPRYADVEAILRNMNDYSNRRGKGS